MSYKFSKGYQIIGDLSGSDDAQRDTGIDFEDNYIGLQTSGSTVFVVSGSKVGIGTTTPDYELHVAGDIGVDQYIRHNGDSNTNINFTDDKINLKAGNLSMITMEEKSSAPHEVRINNGGNNIDFVVEDNSGNAYFTADASTSKIGIGTDTPSHKLDVDGDIRVRGNDIRDNSGNPAVTFDGSANTTIVNNLTVQDYTFPASDGNADQVLQTNGSGQLSFVDVSGGGGGGGSSTPQVLKAGINATFNLSGSAQFQTIPFVNVLFDTFTTGGWDASNYRFVAGEDGYYDISATVVFDELDENVTQYQLWLISNSDHATPNSLVGGYIGLVQLAPTPSDMDMGTLQLNTIAHLSSSQSASVSIRQTGTNNSGTTTLLAPKNRTFICIKKL